MTTVISKTALSGAPRPAPQAASPPTLPSARTLPLATPADLDDAIAMICALIRIAATA
jgi:hypothetical protein